MNRHDQQLVHLGWRRADPPRQPVLFVNPASGGGKAVRAELATHAREHGIEVSVVGPDRTLAALVREAFEGGADALGVAGGDGSLAVVAAAAQQHGVPLVCVPAGTRNHFALDLGVDRHDLVGALEAFTDGVERLIDMGSVNGRLFLNNVSLGIYGEAVRQPAYRGAKARTLLETAREVLGPSAAAPELRLVDDQGREHRNPAVVLVSNNPYALDRPAGTGHAAQARQRLPWGHRPLRARHQPDACARVGRDVARGGCGPAPVHAGIDGEAVDLSPPLDFAILPSALRVRISVTPPGCVPVGPAYLTRRPWHRPRRVRGFIRAALARGASSRAASSAAGRCEAGPGSCRSGADRPWSSPRARARRRSPAPMRRTRGNARAGRLQLAAHAHLSVAHSGDSRRREPHLRMLVDVEEVG